MKFTCLDSVNGLTFGQLLPFDFFIGSDGWVMQKHNDNKLGNAFDLGNACMVSWNKDDQIRKIFIEEIIYKLVADE